jgi:hypothetical protein
MSGFDSLDAEDGSPSDEAILEVLAAAGLEANDLLDGASQR